ncbi:uncharacterized protein LOC143557615 [Bidens hawaiensis]|uniref:uncharacterized protein LOC143557615 n=1 Tax=Bidens hawaiensis TaxID=980011 RepID=UPI0040494B30
MKFSEVQDPIAAMMWISRMEDGFNLMECADEDKVAHGVCMLRSEALVWWETVKVTCGLEAPAKMTWSRFKELFRERFYPVRVEQELMEQFRSIKQGRNESLRGYIARFERLLVFWYSLSAEKRKIYLFVTGLRADIKDFIPTSCMTTFDSMIEAARMIEYENNRRLEATKRM